MPKPPPDLIERKRPSPEQVLQHLPSRLRCRLTLGSRLVFHLASLPQSAPSETTCGYYEHTRKLDTPHVYSYYALMTTSRDDARTCQAYYLEAAEDLDRLQRRPWQQRLDEAEAFERAVHAAAANLSTAVQPRRSMMFRELILPGLEQSIKTFSTQ